MSAPWGSWARELGPVDFDVDCHRVTHRISWTPDDDVVLHDHSDDLDAERAVAALGGEATGCVEILDAYEMVRSEKTILGLWAPARAQDLELPKLREALRTFHFRAGEAPVDARLAFRRLIASRVLPEELRLRLGVEDLERAIGDREPEGDEAEKYRHLIDTWLGYTVRIGAGRASDVRSSVRILEADAGSGPAIVGVDDGAYLRAAVWVGRMAA